MSADLGFPVPPPIAAEAGTSHRMLIYSRLAIMDVWLVFGSLTSQNVIHFGILALAVATFLLFRRGCWIFRASDDRLRRKAEKRARSHSDPPYDPDHTTAIPELSRPDSSFSR